MYEIEILYQFRYGWDIEKKLGFGLDIVVINTHVILEYISS